MTDEELAQRLAEAEARGKSNTHRLDKMEKRQSDLEALTTSVAVLATKQEGMESDVKETKADVKDIQSDVKAIAARKGVRWDSFVDKVIWAALSAAAAYIAARYGL